MPMATEQDPGTDDLIELARGGDPRAREALLARCRPRLLRMVAVRMDRRLSARADPSDVVQEVLAEAARRLPDYLRECPLPFYPWLRQLAWDRLIDLHRRHVRAGKRSVTREEAGVLDLPDGSALELAARLAAAGSTPSEHLLRKELRDRMRAALDRLAPRDREVLALRHLEQLSTRDVAAVLGISEATAKVRHFRALERLQALLRASAREEPS
jgi:RNA polymerase sigma-70 factor (ECF subfamily)